LTRRSCTVRYPHGTASLGVHPHRHIVSADDFYRVLVAHVALPNSQYLVSMARFGAVRLLVFQKAPVALLCRVDTNNSTTSQNLAITHSSYYTSTGTAVDSAKPTGTSSQFGNSLLHLINGDHGEHHPPIALSVSIEVTAIAPSPRPPALLRSRPPKGRNFVGLDEQGSGVCDRT
jgi:hypothetical protein